MGISIYKLFQLTYNDYICNYDHYLSEFLNVYEDNTELYFIKEQKLLLDKNVENFKEIVRNLVEEDENKEEILDLFRNRINTTTRIKVFLEQRKHELEKKLNTTLTTIPATENKHPNMFVNDSFKLFEYILNNHITENRGRINDISFYYWKMYNDNYIIQKPYPFVEWFTKLYNVESFQMKTLNTTQNSDRLKHYSNSLDWFKLQNQ